ncbi:MAG: alpha/beta hydrolase, partial [Metallibacterium sp.]
MNNVPIFAKPGMACRTSKPQCLLQVSQWHTAHAARRGCGRAKGLLMYVLILPGLWNSGPQHWQTQWEARHAEWKRVLQRDWATPDRAE